MKERPILFSAPMVRALLAGTKTQTRRIAKGVATAHAITGEALSKLDSAGPRVACPYGQVGDRLWVREAWRAFAAFNSRPPRDITAGPVWHEAQDDVPFHPTAYGKLRPSMFMPRWASRIMLEVTGVRVERLQDISDADARAEGITSRRVSTGDCRTGLTEAWSVEGACDALHPRGSYELLWEQINGAGSWDANPWVWCVSFRRIG